MHLGVFDEVRKLAGDMPMVDARTFFPLEVDPKRAMYEEKQRSSRLNEFLWRHLRAHQRRPAWQRYLVRTIWFVGAVTLLYLWMSTFDCPIC